MTAIISATVLKTGGCACLWWGGGIEFVKFASGSRNSSVSVVTKLQAGRSGVQIPVGEEDFCVLDIVQADCGINPNFKSNCMEGNFSGVKWPVG